MSTNPFIVPFESLPETLPVFPLPGAIVMPRAELPLNIFEPRYLNMISDALGQHRMIGMIQPEPSADNDIDLCQTGCAGRITQYRETSDCRIEMVLTGVCRFDIGQEMSSTRGYRLIVPDWTRFAGDYDDADELAKDRHDDLVAGIQRYFEVKGYSADISQLARLPAPRLVDSLTMAIPFSNQEKQVLLETVDTVARIDAFSALIGGEFNLPDSITRH